MRSNKFLYTISTKMAGAEDEAMLEKRAKFQGWISGHDVIQGGISSYNMALSDWDLSNG